MIRIEKDVPIEMRDGTILRGDIYRPDDGGKHPAILLRTPYDKSLANMSNFLLVLDAVDAGYAVVAQDVRGRFASGGEWLPEGEPIRVLATAAPERLGATDSYDTIEWLASQPWCDGNVGMQGASWLGFIIWAAALEAPPHLKAIAPSVCADGHLRDYILRGGVPNLEASVMWTVATGIEIAARLARRGKNTADMLRMLYRAFYNPEEVYNFLPLKEVPHFKYEGLQQLFNWWVSDLTADTAQSKDLRWHYAQIKTPCCYLGGWYDLFSDSLFNNFLGMREMGGTQLARDGQYVICGPWPHSGTLSSIAGNINFGPTAAGGPGPGRPRFDPMENGGGANVSPRHLLFFDKYLKGEQVSLPPVRYFIMGANRWRNAQTWPLPETQWQRFYLHSKGHANTAAGDGLLSRDGPGTESPDIFIYNPYFPVPTTGGRGNAVSRAISGPVDQSHIEKRSDVLCYTTPELMEEIEVTGPLKLHLFASTSARDTDFTAKLVDVYPNGSAYNLAEGIIRARHRKSVFQSEPVQPGDVNEYCIDLAVTSNLFQKGHRIRIDISSSNFPRYDRNLNTGNPIGADASGIPAMQTIYHQQEIISYIDLPVIPGKLRA